MPFWDEIVTAMGNKSITVKYGVCIGILVFLMLAIALTGYLSLAFVRKANDEIQLNSKIQQLVFEMDREMEKARLLHSGFFLHYPKIGLSAAHEAYAQPSIRKAASVVSISHKLHRMIDQPKVSQALRENKIDLNLYLSSAKRFAETSIKSFELVTILAAPGTGLEDVLEKHMTMLKSQAVYYVALHDLIHQMDDHFKSYRIKRERHTMQSAFNEAFELRRKIVIEPGINIRQKKQIYTLLEQIKIVGDQILDVDMSIAAKVEDFSLQEKAAHTVSDKFLALVKQEVGKSRENIAVTQKLAIIFLICITLVGLLLAGGVAVVLNANITQRVVLLTRAARKMERGNLEVTAEEGPYDELGQLGRGFNYMVARMKRLVGNLEQEVRDRTLELSDTNHMLQIEIKERKQMEQRFRLAASVMSDLIYEWEIGPDHLLWFGDIDNALGLKSDKILGTMASWQKKIHPEDVDMFADSIQKALASAQPYSKEYRIQCGNGLWRWWFDSAVPVFDSKGRLSKWVGICADITEKKAAQKQSVALEKQLQQSQKMEAIGTLAGGIAHDFNNILYPIIGFAQISIEDLPGDHPVQENLEDILQGARRAQNLVNRILSFSTQTDLEQETLAFAPLVKEALKLLRSIIPSNIEIKQTLSESEPEIYIFANSTQIHEIIMNLCTNSYHALEVQGGTIDVSLDLKTPDPEMELLPQKYCCLSISDNGAGISDEIIEHVFEPYFTTKEQGKGSGLGLSMVHGIVKSYKGGIQIKSEPGKGTQVNIYLPVTSAKDIVVQESVEAEPKTGDERILFVDDEAPIVKLGVRILERLGYAVTGLSSSRKALELFQSDPDQFDLVVTDMTMPDMTGTQMARHLLEIRPDIPILICTGFSEQVDKETAISMGIKGYITKPILMDELSAKVRELLESKK